MNINFYTSTTYLIQLYSHRYADTHIHTHTKTHTHKTNLVFVDDHGNNLLQQKVPVLHHSCFCIVKTDYFEVYNVKHTRHPSNKSSGAWKELMSKFSSSSERGSSLLLIAELHAVSLTPLKLILEMWLTSEREWPLKKKKKLKKRH